MQKLALVFIIFCVLITIVSGCNWRLRGDGASDSVTPKTFLNMGNSGGQKQSTYRELHALLTQQKVLESRAQAKVQLALGEQNFDRRTISANSNARTAEFELTLKIPYKILSQQGTALYSDTALLTRSYRFNEQDIVGENKEEELLKQEMTRDIAQQILRQLNAYFAPQNQRLTDH